MCGLIMSSLKSMRENLDDSRGQWAMRLPAGPIPHRAVGWMLRQLAGRLTLQLQIETDDKRGEGNRFLHLFTYI